MILISKEIAHRLNKECNVRFGENGISTTGKGNGRHKYYLCESDYNIKNLYRITSDESVGQLLKKIREMRKKFNEEN